MGGTITGNGTATCNFKDWGNIERKEEQSTTTTVIKIPFGPTKRDVTKSHSMNKLISGESYSVDFDAKKIYVGDDMAMNLIKTLHPNKDAEEVGRKGMESLGGKLIGKEEILGYECEKWQAIGVTQWTYKGVTLKVESNMAGTHIVEEAIKAKFDIAVLEEDLKLPNFKIVKQKGFMGNEMMEDDIKEGMEDIQRMKKMTFKEWKNTVTKNDTEMQEMSDEELRKIYNMMQQMGR